MRLRGRRVARLAGIGLLALAGSSAGADREDDLQRLRAAIEDSRQRVSAYELEQRGLLETVEALDRSAVALTTAVARAAARAEEEHAKLVAVEIEAQELAVALERTERTMSRRAVALYRAGDRGALSMLFSAEDVRDFLSRVYALRLLLSHDRDLLARHHRQEEALARARSEAREASVRHEAAAQRLRQRSQQLAAERHAKRRLAARLHQSRGAERAALVELETAARGLEETLAQLRDEPEAPSIIGAVAFDTLRGTLDPPVKAPIVGDFGRVVDSEFNTETFRKGLDFEAPRGMDVRAVAAGHVAFAGWFRGYGRLLILDHGDRYFTVYGHLDDIGVQVGQAVASRHVLGSAGDTGSLAGPRLYFEVRRGRESLNPRRWLRSN
ncbi:MAG: peptidoglycan DD-metalloendopeptidase family protein [Deltaproteobacteria bacterium]|nr:peptidoglycan DD-metalloendopeptidase family protein [Deltaproteobacteria bacterium]